VISDGAVTGAEEWLKSGNSIPVNTLRVERRTGPDAQVTDISVPDTLYEGQRYTTLVTVHSNTAGEATLLLSENHETPRTRQVTLRKGENTFAFESVAVHTGVIPCEARILADGDTVNANNANASFTVVTGEMSILLAEGSGGDGEEMRKMLESTGMKVRVIPASMLSEQASELWAYHAIALVNVDADSLSDDQVAALDGAVRELGVGLAVFGGDSSYALGGYRGSKLEEMLPVTIDVRNRMELPTTALVLAIDKSGSMTETSYGVSRLQLAREAACAALEVLNERDQAGVIAFDDAAKWVVPLGPVTDVAAMQEQVATIRIGGGTAFYSPLTMAYEALKTVDAQYKHVIFLTDGEAGDTGYMDVVRRMGGYGITVTTVAVGDGADYAGMKKMAEIGNGRMYAAGPFDSLPRIFTKETMMISGAYVQNRTFTPVITDSTMTDFPGFPELDGYLAVTEKPLATVSLCSDRKDPLLAWWQYGAGKVLSWTSDVQGGWSAAFLNWDHAAEFFSGLVSFILPDRNGSGEITLEDGCLSWETDAPQEAAAASAALVRPDGTKETVRLERVSENRFEGSADTSLSGAYAIRIEMEDGKGKVLQTADGGDVVSWTAEYDQRREDTGALETLAQETGGKTCGTTQELLEFPDTAARKRTDLTNLLAGLALLLFLFDVAQRRLDLFREPAADKAEEAGRQVIKEKKQPKPDRKKPESEGPSAADLLWQQMKDKKKL
jgi:uncharacterized membrane protein